MQSDPWYKYKSSAWRITKQCVEIKFSSLPDIPCRLMLTSEGFKIHRSKYNVIIWYSPISNRAAEIAKHLLGQEPHGKE